ncbi:response regulator [Candidatus Saccharibacteria bacterium]|nr:MAG: response regulator [Candidatus Saccharibacteria bacterium]TXG76083.1 MAG: response regulator [Patescibacteria group bacterium]
MAHILIVEDETSLNEAYTIILKKEGYSISNAFNGVQALEAIKQTEPDLILLDLRMPQMDGVEFLRNLAPLENYPAMKIIVFSNYDVQQDIDEAFKLGATHYMLKAWASPRELVKVVAQTLKETRKTRVS